MKNYKSNQYVIVYNSEAVEWFYKGLFETVTVEAAQANDIWKAPQNYLIAWSNDSVIIDIYEAEDVQTSSCCI